jgi:hypothetical protein
VTRFKKRGRKNEFRNYSGDYLLGFLDGLFDLRSPEAGEVLNVKQTFSLFRQAGKPVVQAI